MNKLIEKLLTEIHLAYRDGCSYSDFLDRILATETPTHRLAVVKKGIVRPENRYRMGSAKALAYEVSQQDMLNAGFVQEEVKK